MNLTLPEIFSAAILLLLVMDPLGNIPIFLSVLKNVDPARRQRIILREVFFALLVLIIFLFFGQDLLAFLHLQQETVSISGGIVLFIIGIRMVFPSRHNALMGATPDEEPFIVPLAIPLIAGPSTIATLILMVHTEPESLLSWFLALLVAWVISAVILLLAPLFFKVLRNRGLAAIERLMGMLLIMISVQMFIDGLKVVL
ncbi:MAG: YhgN family NAAT transporter [Fidelibacterota bacterium]